MFNPDNGESTKTKGVFFGLLYKILDNENALRTNPIAGQFLSKPEVGESFVIFSEPLEIKSADFRIVHTSTVVAISIQPQSIEFSTRNSRYFLVVFGVATPVFDIDSMMFAAHSITAADVEDFGYEN